MGNWNDLKIKCVGDNGFQNGYDYYHVRMGKGFIDALESGIPLKEPIENDSRLEHGVRMLVSTKKAKRNVTLVFNIFGRTEEEYMTHKRTFEGKLLEGLVDIKVNNSNHTEVYHLVYTGKSVSYRHSYNGRFGIFACQFVEPNPDNRSESANEHVRTIVYSG